MQLKDVPNASHSIILCLPDTDVVEEVLDAVTSRLRPGSIVIDTTTADPERTRRLADLLAAADISLIDVSVLASSVITQEGHALLLAGSSSAVLLEVRPVLEAISERLHHVGPVGAGQEMKLVANLVLGLNRAVLAEGLHFARAFSLDREAVLQILTSGVAYSKVMDTKGRKMLDEDFVPQIRLSQHLKDVRLMLEHAKDAQTALPLSNVHRDLLEKAAGNGDLDNSSIIQAWQ